MRESRPAMNGWRKHPLRVTGRLIWVGVELLLAALSYLVHCTTISKAELPVARARWMQLTARRLLKPLHVNIEVAGTVPSRGLLVSNHLGYVDILVFASLTPATFVAKREVRSWPVFGWFARLAGTVFVDREKRFQAFEATNEIEAALKTDVLVILFPEGTSSNGRTVLPFKSSLLEPAARHRPLLSAGHIRYELDDGDPGEEVCYWKDMVLLPHLINLLSKPRVRAFVRFTEVRSDSGDRKAIARELYSEVIKLKAASGC
jgi:1-acyl-sn-glycerol-3-phosphate acyltransferase